MLHHKHWEIAKSQGMTTFELINKKHSLKSKRSMERLAHSLEGRSLGSLISHHEAATHLTEIHKPLASRLPSLIEDLIADV